MSASDSNSSTQEGSGDQDVVLGYLTFVPIPDHGIVGGYLLIDHRARPIEFHCTAPIRSNRVQEILYGATHRSALYCDQVGVALLEQASQGGQRASLILTDEVAATGLRQLTDIPLALFVNDADAQDSTPLRILGSGEERDVGDSLRSEWTFERAGCSFTHAANYDVDRARIREVLLSIVGNWDLAEPLERIRLAIQEAQRAAA